ncbi:MAG TPA: hypothetical protein VN881_03575 [Candidatus Acidoferrales bacterium]|nr:hypothetical protein [Candidatus Acidoferrales bacterium]
MPAKKSSGTKKTRKMHAAKKLESVKPLTVETNLLTTSIASPPQPSHTGVYDGNSFTLGPGSPSSSVGGPGASSSTIPTQIISPGKLPKP